MSSLILALRQIVGDNGVLDRDQVSNRPVGYWQEGQSSAEALVRPASTDQVASILRICQERGLPVVTQGGQTGLLGGHLSTTESLILSTERLNSIAPVNVANRSVIAGAGVILNTLHSVVEDLGLLFAVDLGARGSCTIGGMISTNAGGNAVLRYGMTREQVLGVEAVLADGSIISSMKPLIKNNTGYDIKQLFIGSEGTLGVVTQAALRLRPLPISCQTALLGVNGFEHLRSLLVHFEKKVGSTLSAFEVLWNNFYRLNTGEHATRKPPLSSQYDFYLLVETRGSSHEADQAEFENTLAEAMENGLVADAVIARSGGERDQLWSVREDMEPEKRRFGRYLYDFDVSLGIDDMPQFEVELKQHLKATFGDYELLIFGHLADGNLHIGIGEPGMLRKSDVEQIVFELVEKFNGSISAEHGIGRFKRDSLHYARSPQEISLMQMMKRTIDSKNILNPGKTIPG